MERHGNELIRADARFGVHDDDVALDRRAAEVRVGAQVDADEVEGRRREVGSAPVIAIGVAPA
jgi:hypothetical protein